MSYIHSKQWIKLVSFRFGSLLLSKYFLFILIVSTGLGVVSSINLKYESAISGHSPSDYVHQTLYPENFEKDFLGKSFIKNHYDRSLVMRSFVVMKRYLGVGVDDFTPIFMIAQVFVFIYSLFLLLHAFGLSSILALGLAVPAIFLSPLAGVGLARFGAWPFLVEFPLYYGFALSFFILAYYFHAKKRFSLLFFSLLLSSVCHIMIGLIGLAFIGAPYLLRSSTFKNRDIWLGILGYIIIVGFYIFYFVGLSNETVLTGGIPTTEWVNLTKAFGSHWYPLTMAMFTLDRAEFRGLIILAILSIPVLLNYRKRNRDGFNDLAISILFVVIILSPLGVIFSEFFYIPTLIKMALHRSLSFATFILFCLYGSYLLIKASSGSTKEVALSTLALIIVLFKSNTKITVFDLNYLLILVESLRIIKLPSIVPSRFSNNQLALVTLVMGLILWTGVFSNYYEAALKRGSNRSKAYYDIQNWAKENTPVDSLFMIDPANSYAWRDYSARSSFGTLRDWGYISNVYKSDPEKLREGARRAKLFGVNFSEIIDEVKNKNVIGPSSHKYGLIARKNFYAMTPKELKELASKEGADYIILERFHMSESFLKNEKFVYDNYFFFALKVSN